MERIIVDDELTGKLRGMREEFEVCDASGKARGVFLPWERYERMMYDLLRAQVSDEEVAALAQKPRVGKPLSTIWKQLGRS